MKKHFVLACLLLLLLLPAYGQEQQALRDSLSTLIHRIDREPNNVQLRLYKAAINMQLEQWEDARDEYTAVLRLDGGNLTALRFRGYAYERLGSHDMARADYERVLQSVPDHFEVLLGLALLNQKDRRFTLAMDQINRLVELYPNRALVYAARAGMEQERDMLELAEYDFGEAIRLDPTNADYLISRAEVRIAINHKKPALADLTQAMSLGIPRSQVEHLLEKCR